MSQFRIELRRQAGLPWETPLFEADFKAMYNEGVKTLVVGG